MVDNPLFLLSLFNVCLILQGLAEHKDELGAPLCPCRHYDDKAAEAANGFWNCPCVPMRERKVRINFIKTKPLAIFHSSDPSSTLQTYFSVF